ncbi:MAG TPA: hypothetical protein DCM64_11905 [Gammaproteobacteria bacterium]|nr:hypothetical protein [Gammaproteobacteria bacterium]|tara:strand:- start:447 stop:1616 length:1170 start_codon:yes stop_codon:yes gene_type:complete
MSTSTEISNLIFDVIEDDSGLFTLKFEITFPQNTVYPISVNFLYWPINGAQTWVNASQSTSGIYSAIVSLPQDAVSGVYEIRRIDVVDNTGVERNYGDDYFTLFGLDNLFSLLNPNSDSAYPILEDWQIGPIVISEGAIYSDVYIKASDQGSAGLTNALIVEFLSPTGTSLQKWFAINENGEASGKFYFSEYAASGDYVLNTIRLYDTAGNSNLNLGINTTYALENPNGDDTPPVITDFKLDAYFNESKSSFEVKLSYDFIEAGSGFHRAYIRYKDSIGNTHDHWISSSSQAVLDLPVAVTEGTGNLVYFFIEDYADNRETYYANDLESLGFDTSINFDQEIKSATYSLTAFSDSYDEGDTAGFGLVTTNVEAGTLIAYTISGVSYAIR